MTYLLTSTLSIMLSARSASPTIQSNSTDSLHKRTVTTTHVYNESDDALQRLEKLEKDYVDLKTRYNDINDKYNKLQQLHQLQADMIKSLTNDKLSLINQNNKLLTDIDEKDIEINELQELKFPTSTDATQPSNNPTFDITSIDGTSIRTIDDALQVIQQIESQLIAAIRDVRTTQTNYDILYESLRKYMNEHTQLNIQYKDITQQYNESNQLNSRLQDRIDELKSDLRKAMNKTKQPSNTSTTSQVIEPPQYTTPDYLELEDKYNRTTNMLIHERDENMKLQQQITALQSAHDAITAEHIDKLTELHNEYKNTMTQERYIHE